MVKTKEDLPFWDKYVDIKENPEHFGIPKDHIARMHQLRGEGFTPTVIYDIGSAVGHWKVAMEDVWPEARTFLFEANEKNKIPLLTDVLNILNKKLSSILK